MVLVWIPEMSDGMKLVILTTRLKAISNIYINIGILSEKFRLKKKN